VSIEPNDQHARSDVAGTLRRLRKAAGLSGERLAVRCNMSQSKISRIESGKTLPTVVDVERILIALDVPADVAQDMLALARRANVGHISWRAVAEVGLWRKQTELKALAETSSVQRLFNPAIPSGLLQTPEYVRQVLTPMVDSGPAWDAEKAVQARLDRQRVLDDLDRRFLFVLTEQAVRWKRARREVVAQQCAHIAELSRRPNMDIAIVPQSAEVFAAPLNSFVVYDDRLVLAELFSGEVALRDPKDIAHHMDLFEFFRARALTGDRARALLLSVKDEFM
jgi:transcriptional regulator with XRE-family HTH domain